TKMPKVASDERSSASNASQKSCSCRVAPPRSMKTPSPLDKGGLQGGFECRNKPTLAQGDCHNPLHSHQSVLTLRFRNLAPVIAARSDPLIGVGSFRPGLPARRQVLDNPRMAFRQAVELRAVRREIIELPAIHVLRNELPFAEADRPIS